jgi:hypothetical protein
LQRLTSTAKESSAGGESVNANSKAACMGGLIFIGTMEQTAYEKHHHQRPM